MQPASHENNRIIFRFMVAMVLVYALLGLFSGLPAGANLTAFVIGLILLFLGGTREWRPQSSAKESICTGGCLARCQHSKYQ